MEPAPRRGSPDPRVGLQAGRPHCYLNPVHIGSGDTLDPTGYVIDGDTLYQFDPSAPLAALGPEQRSELLAITSGAPNIAMLKKAQQFFDRHREPLIAAAGHWMPVSPAIAEEYRQRIGNAANIENDGKQVIDSLEIQQCFRNPISRQPIIPGSSIKGAIRTALLDAVNGGKPLSQADKKGHDRFWNAKLQQRLFKYGPGRFELNPMRLIQIADAPYSGPDDVDASKVLFAVNRKRHPIRKNGELLKPQAEKQNRGYLDSAWRDTDESLMFGELARRIADHQAFVLRVGYHSGAESVTLDGLRNIKIIQDRGNPPAFCSEAKTWWLANAEQDDQRSLIPFGWVIVEFLPADQPPPPWPEADCLLGPSEESGRAWAVRQARGTGYSPRPDQYEARHKGVKTFYRGKFRDRNNSE